MIPRFYFLRSFQKTDTLSARTRIEASIFFLRRILVFIFFGLSFPLWSQSTLHNRPAIRVGVEIDAAPLTMLNSKGEPTGFSVELVKAVARERSLDLVFVVEPWDQLLSDFNAGKLDLIANMGYSREREKFVQFAVAHLVLHGAVFIRDNGPVITSPDQMSEHSIGTLIHSLGHEYAIKRGWTDHIVPVATLQEALQGLADGKFDTVIATQIVATKLIHELQLKAVKAAPFELNDLNYELHMAVHRDDSDLLYELNTGLVSVRVKGIYETLYDQWIGGLEPRSLRWRDLKPYLLPTLIVILSLGLVFWRLRHILGKLQRQTDALRTSEERLTLVLEGSQDAFWDWDVTTGQVERSARWAEILGMRSEDIPPHIDGLKGLVHPDDRERMEENKQRILDEGSGRSEYRLKAQDGSWRWIFDRGKVVARDSAGKPARMTGAASDITARKKIEDQLTRSQALLEQSQEAAEIGGWEYEVESRTLYWTKETFRIHDLETVNNASLTVEKALSFFTPTYQPILSIALERAIEKGQSFDLELELVTAGKRLIWVRTIGRAEPNGERVTRIHGSLQDITKRKKADEERQKLQLKMLEAQKLESLGVLAGGIAHDFNNLLTVVIGNASLAREDPSGSPEALEQIETAAHRAADLCRQMLAYAGKSRFSLELHDLNAVVEDTVHLLKLSINKNAALDFSLAPGTLPIDADSSQIRQVIMNLVINASEAIGNTPGRVRLTTSKIQVTQEMLRDAQLGQDLPAGKYVAFDVEDNGCGMTASTMARIFDPFFTTKFTGRGLGLAAVLGIVRAHRGAFFVKSTLGKGSTFRMLLPRAASGGTAAPMPSVSRVPVSRPKGDGTILVVDDEPDVRRIASVILERQGYNVTVASDGYEALALALAHGLRFKAVLLDVTMPGLDGPATLRELRAQSTTLPIMMMSGFSETDARKNISNDPLVNFLPKPFTADDLLSRLEKLIEAAAKAKALLKESGGRS